uniref:Structural/gag protein n=1 Tax=Rosellinia necatrix mycovirus TaxID=2759762 RepID=A0A7G4WLZ6_9VIRU|nr:structural/gag protein [Rosellinia necatrix mycovirus]
MDSFGYTGKNQEVSALDLLATGTKLTVAGSDASALDVVAPLTAGTDSTQAAANPGTYVRVLAHTLKMSWMAIIGYLVAAAVYPWQILAHLGMWAFEPREVTYDLTTAEGRRAALFGTLLGPRYSNRVHTAWNRSVLACHPVPFTTWVNATGKTRRSRTDLPPRLRNRVPMLPKADKLTAQEAYFLKMFIDAVDNTPGYDGVLAAKRNRAMHALNGNIEAIERTTRATTKGIEVTGELRVAADYRLGGAMPVLTEYLFGAQPQVSGPVTASTFDGNLLRERVTMNLATTADDRGLSVGTVSTRNRYTLTYPVGSGRMPTERDDTNHIRFVVRSNRMNDILVQRAPPRPSRELGGPNFLIDESLAALWRNWQDPVALKDAETVLSSQRFTGVRGNRQVLGWEARAPIRQQALHALAMADSQGSSYFRFMFRLMSLYFAQSISEAGVDPVTGLRNSRLIAPTRNADDLAYDPAGPAPWQRTRLVPLSAYTPAAAAGAGVNPEAPLQDDLGAADNINDIANGAAAFVDAEAMSDEMLRLVIWALTPAVRDGAHRLSVGERTWESPLQRYTEDMDHGVSTIYLHYGARAPPGTQEQVEGRLLGRGFDDTPSATARSPWTAEPSRALIAQVINHFIRKHHAATDAWNAFDLVLHLAAAYTPSTIRGAAPAAPFNPVNCFGTRTLTLPPDLTAPAYFDCVRRPMDMPEHATHVAGLLSLTPRELVRTAFYTAHANATSLNWASYALSMRNEEWLVANGGPGNHYRTNLAAQLTSRLYDTEITPWQLMHRAATAHMYEFAPMLTTVHAVGTLVVAEWAPNSTPFMGNPYHDMWMLKKLPRHMLLPLENTVPSWPENEPRPMFSPTETASPRVRVARDLALFTGRAWVQDGGMMANLQYYAATPNATPTHRNIWRSDENAPAAFESPMVLGSWNSPYQYEWPANPNEFTPQFIASPGSVFGAYLRPGSVQNYDSGANRIRAVGARLVLAERTADAWARLTLDREQANVAIAYKAPTGYRVELPPVNDYSMLVWSTYDGYYAGMSLVTHDAPTNRLPLASTEGMGPQFPAHLANHNNPHAPTSDGRLSSFAPVGNELIPRASARIRPGVGSGKRLHTAPGPIMQAQATPAPAPAPPLPTPAPPLQQPLIGTSGDSSYEAAERAARRATPFSPPPPSANANISGALGPAIKQASPRTRTEAAARIAEKQSRQPGRQRPVWVHSRGVKLNSPGTQAELEEVRQRLQYLREDTGVDSPRDVPNDSPQYKTAQWLARRFDHLLETLPSEDVTTSTLALSEFARPATLPPDGIITAEVIDANDSAARDAQRAAVRFADTVEAFDPPDDGELFATTSDNALAKPKVTLPPAPILPDSGEGTDYWPGGDTQFFHDTLAEDTSTGGKRNNPALNW